MSLKRMNKLSLELGLSTDMLPVFLAVVEKSALAFAMAEREAMFLTLSAEEVFTYLAQAGTVEESVRMVLSDGGYYIRLDFIFSDRSLNLRAFNLSNSIDLSDENRLNEIGLLIAARTVDRILIEFNQQGSIQLTLIKDKSYPLGQVIEPKSAQSKSKLRFTQPGSDDLKLFCQMVPSLNSAESYPDFFNYPGKVVDMMRSGDYQALLAYDEQDHIQGGIVWEHKGRKTVEFYGPYSFKDSPEISEGILEQCLQELGRSEASGIMNRNAEEDLYAQYFETFGHTRFYKPDGTISEKTTIYRQLGEDPGSRVWTHPNLVSFLEAEYRRLYLPRDILTSVSMGEQAEAYSVLTAAFDQKTITLRVLLAGKDAEENLIKHLQLFRQENYLNIFFELDLGQAWQSEMVPALLACHFAPCLIMPYAGKADVVLFQYQTDVGEMK